MIRKIVERVKLWFQSAFPSSEDDFNWSLGGLDFGCAVQHEAQRVKDVK